MNYRGFTLIELIAVIAILGFVSLAITSAITYFYKSNRTVMQSIAAANTARAASIDFVRNIRQASYGDDGSYPLYEAASSSITFFSNADDDASLEKMHWFASNGTLYRGVTKYGGGNYQHIERTNATFPFLQDNASTTLFQYFDAQGAELMDPVDVTAVRSVKMNVSVSGSAATTSMFSISNFATFRLFVR